MLCARGQIAYAQYGARASVTAPEEDATDDRSATVTSVSARTFPRVLANTAELLLEVPGTRTLQFGPWGSFSTLYLRGADPAHTVVYFGDIPLTPPDGGAVDLSTIPPWILERMDVFRGGSPTWIGAGAMGGIIRLIPRESETSTTLGRIGIGSFGLLNFDAMASHHSRSRYGTSLFLNAAAGVTKTQGDFLYRDNGGTFSTNRDDVIRKTSDGNLQAGYGLLHGKLRWAHSSLEGLASVFVRNGPPLIAAEQARTFFSRTNAGVSYLTESAKQDLEGLGWQRFQAIANVNVEQSRFRDPLSRVGLGAQDTNDVLFRAYTRLSGSWRTSDLLRLTAVGSYTLDEFWPHDALARVPNQSSSRQAASLAGEAQISDLRTRFPWEIRLSARGEVLYAGLHQTEKTNTDVSVADQAVSSTQLAPTFRIAGWLQTTRFFRLTTSLSQAVRFPNTVELFGNRSFTLGNIALKPEKSYNADIGGVASGRLGTFSGRMETRAFAQRFTDLINYTRNDAKQAIPINIDYATIVGAEFGLRGQWSRSANITGTLTTMRTWDQRGFELPLRPRLQLYVRPELMLAASRLFSSMRLYADAVYMSSNYLDATNIPVVENRFIVGCGAISHFSGDRIEVAVGIRDIFNQQGFDITGFPLPGRSIGATLTLRSN